ncbi:MFS transporter [Acidaminobacter sp. JC074]|uniref:MFS transporter n=1 Tax=Acidaminobacter sp. JC074 TaxID=2530199 RepID=UPI001F0E8CF0|nr:MFS transporter [Acidaminobacter sp. JC074]MCH4886798.1 MFS transporter [Acidaminobacter sp. JC074]
MKFNKQEISWILYDCGNSAYSMAITTALLPVYFGMFKAGDSMDLGYFNSIASIIVAILSPILGTIADYKDTKKRFFTFFAILGIFFTAALTFVPFGVWQMLILFYVLTVVGFSGANIFYDSFLVDITSNERMDKVSSNGFAWGYIASVIPFAISLGIIALIGLDEILGYQLSFLITALWWGLFTIPFFRHVKQVHYIEREPSPVKNSFKRIWKTVREIRKHKVIAIFMLSYFFYINGVGTIIKMCVPYAQVVLGADSMDMFAMLGILLIVQIIAFPCAILYGILAKKYSSKRMLIIGMVTYIIATIYAFNMNSITDVFILGAMIGSAQGGMQALSRSYFAKLVPKKQSNEFFGFYNINGKFATVLGPFMMSLTADITGNGRYSILAIIPLFIIGLIVFLRLPSDKLVNEGS